MFTVRLSRPQEYDEHERFNRNDDYDNWNECSQNNTDRTNTPVIRTFTSSIPFTMQPTSPVSYNQSSVCSNRIAKILTGMWGGLEKLKKQYGDCIVETVTTMYEWLTNSALTFPNGSVVLNEIRKATNKRTGSYYTLESAPALSKIDTLQWFIAGGFSDDKPRCPSLAVDNKRHFDPPFICSTIFNTDIPAVIHVNVQVAHWIINAKERLGAKVHGRSLVRTVEKKKCVAASGYKNVVPDEILPTANSINLNLHGHDLLLITTLINIEKNTRSCSIDRSLHVKVSHIRSSTNSLQHGLLNTNNYRWKLIEKHPNAFRKLDRFPAVVADNLGIVHREAVLVDEKNFPERSVKRLEEFIASVGEIDETLAATVYEEEAHRCREIMDNHVLAIIKLAHFTGHTINMSQLTYDRMLVAQNPKMALAEFADKSKFAAENKGKASKKIKIVNKKLNRAEFISRMNLKHPDLFVDPFNNNTRGKWSLLDRMHHSPDAVFYSELSLSLLNTVKAKYAVGYESFVGAVQDMIDEIELKGTTTMRFADPNNKNNKNIVGQNNIKMNDHPNGFAGTDAYNGPLVFRVIKLPNKLPNVGDVTMLHVLNELLKFKQKDN
ncbi:hypothetical protein EGW08_021968 [Elysia chlorotica]|uniref:Uncharacterized protein n=1 Tax=Elysia chlorotica TaxID=188477 RepID=A0A3S1BM43_ELYCH|nr:hypothetical protein EGW08_021968 [Elysia chlorotica]